jgi:calcineurin-like phosphoesterase family protein
MNCFFTSDHHFGHVNIIQYSRRPFANVVEMNEAMVDRHNAVVRDEDEVYFVGDLALDDKYVALFAPRLKGKKILVPGNHDSCHPMHRRHTAACARFRDWGFTTIQERMVRDLPFGRSFICHMPLRNITVEHDQRYIALRPEEAELDEQGCKYLLHGHVHEKWKRRGRMINVGVDQWNFTPVSVEELGQYIRKTEPA